MKTIKGFVRQFFLLLYLISRFVEALLRVVLFSNLRLFCWKAKVREKKECVILGNGPSFRETLKSPSKFQFIKKREAVCVNDFAQSDYFNKIKPRYYVMIDDALWKKDSSRRIKALYNKTYQEIRNKVNWKMTLYLPMWAMKWNYFIKLPKENAFIDIKYVNTTPVFCINKLRFFMYQHCLAMPQSENVLIGAIFISLNLGFKKTYVFGADHSWHETLFVGENNTLYFRDPHFYDNKKSKMVPVFITPQEKKTISVSQQFASLSRAFISHEVLNDYSRYLNSQIYNASEKSYIDAYKRYKISDVKKHN